MQKTKIFLLAGTVLPAIALAAPSFAEVVRPAPDAPIVLAQRAGGDEDGGGKREQRQQERQDRQEQRQERQEQRQDRQERRQERQEPRGGGAQDSGGAGAGGARATDRPDRQERPSRQERQEGPRSGGGAADDASGGGRGADRPEKPDRADKPGRQERESRPDRAGGEGGSPKDRMDREGGGKRPDSAGDRDRPGGRERDADRPRGGEGDLRDRMKSDGDGANSREERREDRRDQRQDERRDDKIDRLQDRNQDLKDRMRDDKRDDRRDQRQDDRRDDKMDRLQDRNQDLKDRIRDDKRDDRRDRNGLDVNIRLDALKNQRRERRDGDRVIITEPGGRTIIRDGNRTIIRRDETSRFRVNARDVREERRGGEIRTVVTRPDGSRVITVTDEDGRLIKRIRESGGREYVLIDNSPRGGRSGVFVDLDIAPPRVAIPRERYVLDDEASQDDMEEAFEAEPVERPQRSYSLDEIRQSAPLRQYVRSVDLDAVTFDTGSWEVRDDQINKLEKVGRAMEAAVKKNPRTVFMVEGHTDAVGSDEDNLSLSDRRAESVAEVITKYFDVPAENLTTQGYGEQYLKEQTDGPSETNRRVTVRNITSLLSTENAR